MPRRSGPKYLPTSRGVDCPEGYRKRGVHARSDANAENPARANRQMYEGRAYFGKPVGASRRRSKRTPDSVRPQRRQPKGRVKRIVSTKRADKADREYDERMEDDVEFAEQWDNWKRECTDETIDACRSENRDAKGRFVSFSDDKEIGSVSHWPEEGDDFGWWVTTKDGEQSGPYTLAEAKRIARIARVKKGKKSGKKSGKRKKSKKKPLSGGARSGARAERGPAYPKYSLKPVKPMDAHKYGRQVMCVREDVVKAACEAKGKAIRTYQSGPRTGQEYCGYRKKSKRKKRKSKPRPRSSKKK